MRVSKQEKERGIRNISEFFEVYKKKLTAPERTVISAATELFNDLYGITLSNKQISYSAATKTLAISAPGPIQSEIRLHKEEILAHLRARLGEKSAPKSIV